MVVDVLNDLDAGVDNAVWQVTIENGALVDDSLSQNPYIQGSSEYKFTVISEKSPELVNRAPTNMASDVSADTSVQLTFDRQMKAGSGFIVFSPQDGFGEDVDIDVEDGSAVTFSSDGILCSYKYALHHRHQITEFIIDICSSRRNRSIRSIRNTCSIRSIRGRRGEATTQISAITIIATRT